MNSIDLIDLVGQGLLSIEFDRQTHNNRLLFEVARGISKLVQLDFFIRFLV